MTLEQVSSGAALRAFHEQTARDLRKVAVANGWLPARVDPFRSRRVATRGPRPAKPHVKKRRRK